MLTLKQADRLMQFTSPLGKDVLLIESISGGEATSRLFDFQAVLLAPAGMLLDPKALVGVKVSVSITLSDAQGARWINGIVASFERRPGDEEFDIYMARIVPAMWQLTLSSNCRVFQGKTVLDIAKAVIGEYGLSISDQTSGTYKPLEYCTQYSETDFQFVSRILEESGIYFWFEHTDQDNKIMLGDSRTAYQDCPLSASVPYALDKRGAEGAYGAVVTEFTSTATMVSGKHSGADYNFRTFARADTADKASNSPYGKNAFDQYLYPAGSEGYANDATQPISDLQTLFLETRELASDAVSEVLSGTSSARSFCTGYTFTLSGHPQSLFNRKYLLTAVSLEADQVPPYRVSSTEKTKQFKNQFTAVSSDIVYKPALTNAKPRIYGPQTALVVGPSGEEIYLDEFGRIKVQFFWDKLNSRGATTDTTWVRVAQSWAGNGWGTYHWPRVNDEVVVQFLNGDPDNPVVTGSVYNGLNAPPYPLPDNGTRSGIKTRSSKGGSASNANELRFEDKMGSEQIYIHAEKDMDTSVEHDRRATVGNNDSLTITGNQTELVKGNYNRKTQGNTVEAVTGNVDLKIGGNQTESVGGNLGLKVTGNQAESVGGNHGLKVTGSQSISVGSAYSLNSDDTIYINGGMNVVIQAGMELSLVAAGNFVTIGPSGVSISGTMVLINSGGAAGSGSVGDTGSPGSPGDPGTPDTVDDSDGGGTNAGGAGGSPGTAGIPPSGPGGASSLVPTPPALPAGMPSVSSLSDAAGGALGAAAGAVKQVAQGAQNAVEQVRHAADQLYGQAQQVAKQAEQAAQQAAKDAQRAAQNVEQDARKAFQQAQQAVDQAKQAVSQAVGQAKAAAEGALNQAQQAAQQCAQQGAQAVKQAQQAAQQVQQQAQQAAQQAAQTAKQAQQQAQTALDSAKQGATQAAQDALKQGQQAAAQAKQEANQVENQAEQAGNQVRQAASQAGQAAQSASQNAQAAARNAISQAGKGF